MKLCVNVIALSLVYVVSVKSDTSYLPPPASGGPYPASVGSTPAAASYPSSAAPYPSSGAPYPSSGVPYPSSGAPYPSPGAPYPPSGWKSTGQKFSLPLRQTTPQQSYGPPKTTSGFDVEFTTVEPVTSPRPEPESENLNEFSAEERIPDSGLYYVLLPDGRLQKVTYVTMPLEDVAGKLQFEPRSKQELPHGYSAHIKYQDVEPIRGPIYAYNSAPLVRIFK